MTSRPTRIVIADENASFRRILHSLLQTGPGFQIVAEAATGCDAIAAVQQYKPDILLLDLRLPDISGLEVLKHLTEQPTHRTIVLAEDLNAHLIFEALLAGACGAVDKGATSETFCKCVRSVAAGEVWISR